MNHHINFTYKNYNSDFAIERMLGASKVNSMFDCNYMGDMIGY
jgi:hypothetical protein